MSQPFPSRSFRSREPLHRRNGKIRAREIRVIDHLKQPLGVMSLADALALARDRGMDLIEIAPTANPPVCRIVDYGKFLYDEAKRNKHSQSQQSGSKLKEIQLSPVIDPHDLAVKLNHAIRFLCEDATVRVKLRFRGRQKAHKELGFDIMNKFVQEARLYGHADTPPKIVGDRDMNVTLIPLPRSQREKNARQAQAKDAAPAARPMPEKSSSDAVEGVQEITPAPAKSN